VHLLASAGEPEAISRAMQYVGRRYVPYVNAAYGRSGTLWEGRFKACLVQGLDYVLACYRYIELNPVRAGMVEAPGDYPWSSYRHNALGQADPLVVEHDDYRVLGGTAEDRQAAYCRLFASALDPRSISQLRACLQTGTPFGNDRFRAEIEATLGRAVGFSQRGRPTRTSEAAEPAMPGGQMPLTGL
jgi:putative transposase